MKQKILGITIQFAILLLLVAGCLFYMSRQEKQQLLQSEQIVAVNELEQLARAGKLEEMSFKAEQLQENIRMQEGSYQGNGIFIMCGVCLVFLLVIFSYVYFAMLRPFERLQEFAREIAQGNFDIPLQYERTNYFGAFTWAFDSMRREITKARACEREAIENNKTVIATLSHDIKTPIASIRAYAEGLEANMDSSPERRQRYLGVIMKKCDEVSALTNDLFLHSLADLDKLRMNLEELELCSFVKAAVEELGVEHKDITFVLPDFSAMVMADKNRLLQSVENLINNAGKYARSRIEVSVVRREGNAEIHIRDYGSGIPDKDMPFIFDKFYRGGNCGEEQGSGLGLYIVKYVTEQMQGRVMLRNHADGLEAVISLPVKRFGS